MLFWWSVLTVAAFILNLTKWLENVGLVLVGAGVVALFAAMHFNKRVRISKDGVDFGGNDDNQASDLPSE
jgi:hypothetical protein